MNVLLLDLQLPLQSVHITTKVVISNSVHGEVYSMHHYMIKFVSDLHDVTEILLKVALNTINLTLTQLISCNIFHFFKAKFYILFQYFFIKTFNPLVIYLLFQNLLTERKPKSERESLFFWFLTNKR